VALRHRAFEGHVVQYILTQEELDKLKAEGKDRTDKQLKILQDLCTKVADHMPIKWGWGDKPDIPKPWGCIITEEANSDEPHYEWYCDQCPVRKVCPYNRKNFSQ
jgi:hypothetical protein